MSFCAHIRSGLVLALFLSPSGCGGVDLDAEDRESVAATAIDDPAGLFEETVSSAVLDAPGARDEPGAWPGQTLTMAKDAIYPATHGATYKAEFPFGALKLPVTAAGQAFFLESRVVLANCTAYKACETSLEIKCFDSATGAQILPQVWSGRNTVAGGSPRNMIARMVYITTSAKPLTCKAEFYNHDHGIAGGSVTVRASGSHFFVRPLSAGAANTGNVNDQIRLSSAVPDASLKQVGWQQVADATGVSYLGDFQATECHSKYPRTATNPAKECTTAESGTDTVVEYTAIAIELKADGSICKTTQGETRRGTVSPLVHHEMFYSAVNAYHAPECANAWRFKTYVAWKGGRSFMVRGPPYGQGNVRPLFDAAK